jgi:hypothetical protein
MGRLRTNDKRCSNGKRTLEMKKGLIDKAIKHWIKFCEEDFKRFPDWYDNLAECMLFHIDALKIALEEIK